MATALELIRENKPAVLWKQYCGFIDFDINQFMAIQENLLLEQIDLLKRCELGQKLLGNTDPKSIYEFIHQIPLTTYDDYAPYLPERIEKALPEKPSLWQRTSGRSSEYSYKWVPVTQRVYQELGDAFMALLIFASCRERGEVLLNEHDNFLYALAPPPYASGCWAHRVNDEAIFDFLPPIEEAEGLDFRDRIEHGFKLGLGDGIDIMAGISILLLTVGERFGEGGHISSMIPLLRKPKMLGRLMRATIRSKLAGRPIMPRDIWTLKALISSGTDATIYRERIKNLWGRYPLEIYGATETVIIAMQTWDYDALTFVPFFNLLEFLPLDEYQKWMVDPIYRPKTLLLNEVVSGEQYVIVISNYMGGPFVRYVLGDIIEITASRNAALQINIPQMLFSSRADGLLDFAGTSLTEKTIWQAIENTGIGYVDWVACKETEGKPKLHLYIETKYGNYKSDEVAYLVDHQLSIIRADYDYMVNEEGHHLLDVTLLPQGAFENYIQARQEAGADPAHLKPPHINPDSKTINRLLAKEEEKIHSQVK